MTKRTLEHSWDKYDLYQNAVQSVEQDAWLYRDLYKQARGAVPKSLREDFCGTFALAQEWVRSDAQASAIALDLDPEPLTYGLKAATELLTPEQARRLDVRKQNVLTRTRPVDLAVAGNFSFFIFKKKDLLVDYFKFVRRSLKPGRGMFILDLAGGSSMTDLGPEHRKVRSKRWGPYTYVWDAISFNPITHDAKFAIHFKFDRKKSPTKTKTLKNAFEYDWRLWSIPEVREALEQAGFKKTVVFWDTSRSRHTERYRIAEKASNDESWIAYVAGLI